MSHTLRMILGCVLPLLLIFLLPLIGISENVTVFIAIVLMFACHLLMIGGHGGHEQQSDGHGKGEHRHASH